jgi:hypothetical protein
VALLEGYFIHSDYTLKVQSRQSLSFRSFDNFAVA